jgi:hypothetical protein
LILVNYPTLLAHSYRRSLIEGVSEEASEVRELSFTMGIPVSTTHFASTMADEPPVVDVGSAVSAGVTSACPTPNSDRPRCSTLYAAFSSRSVSNPHVGQECSRTHNGFSDSTPHSAHSCVVPSGSTLTKFVPSRSHLYSRKSMNVRHDADAQFRLFDDSCIIP